MRNLRHWLGVFLALVFSAVVPSAYAGPDKQFTINVTTPASVSLGATNVPFSVTVSNETPNGNSNTVSMKIYVPAGLAVVGTPVLKNSNNNNTYPGTVTVSGQTISIKDLSPLKPQQALRVQFNANVSATSCTALIWTSQAWTGNSFGGDEFAFLTAAVMAAPPFNKTVSQSTNVTGAKSLSITSPASGSSVLAGTNVPVTVAVTDACANPDGTQVTLASTLSATINSPQGVSGGAASFAVNFSAIGPATLTASATGYSDASIALKVFDDALNQCEDADFDALSLLDPSFVPQFQSGDGGSAVGQTGYLAGSRGLGDSKSNSSACTSVAGALVNNIPTTNTIARTDPQGNTVPVGFFSFTFDASNPNVTPVVGLVSTYRPEWGDATTGLPTLQTKICTNTGCSTSEVLAACVSSLVQHASLPTGKAACLAAETWNVVPVSQCAGSPPSGSNPPRCLQATSVIIAGKDPVFGR